MDWRWSFYWNGSPVHAYVCVRSPAWTSNENARLFSFTHTWARATPLRFRFHACGHCMCHIYVEPERQCVASGIAVYSFLLFRIIMRTFDSNCQMNSCERIQFRLEDPAFVDYHILYMGERWNSLQFHSFCVFVFPRN